MTPLNILLTLLLLALSLPVGFLIAWLARDELVQGRRWFQALMALAVAAGIILLFLQAYAAALTCLFVFIVTFISYRKSFDKAWVKRKF